VPSSIRALPIRKSETQLSIDTDQDGGSTTQSNNPVHTSVKQKSRPVPLAPRRYKLQVTIGEETRDKLNELQGLLSHQIPDGDPAEIFDRALDALLTETKKRKAGLTGSACPEWVTPSLPPPLTLTLALPLTRTLILTLPLTPAVDPRRRSPQKCPR
jgi:hypothetical protein